MAIVAWLLVLVLAFNLFKVFARLHRKLLRDPKSTPQNIAGGLDRALEPPDPLVPLGSG